MQQYAQRQALEQQQHANAQRAYANNGYGNSGSVNYGGFEQAEAQRQAERQWLEASHMNQANNRAYGDMWRDREMQIPETEIRRKHNNNAYQTGSNESVARRQAESQDQATFAKERMNAVNAQASKDIASSMGSAFGGGFGGGFDRTPGVGLFDNAGRKIGGSYSTIGQSLLK
jgi:hypothetical protein